MSLKRNKKSTGKITSFLKRNIKNNKHLYDIDEGLNGIEFLTCPILKVRMLRMQPSYITNVLEMTIEEFDNKYPNFKKTCDRLSKQISKGLNEIDEIGITKYQKSQINAHVTRNIKNKFGITPNKQIGISTRKTHMNAIDEHGLNGYQRIAKYRNETILDNGLSIQQQANLKKKGTVGRGASKLSKEAFSSIIDILENNNIKYYYDKNEYTLTYNNKNYQYDLTIPELNISIEYQSNRYHPNKNWTKEKWDSWYNPYKPEITPEQAYEYDKFKSKILFEERNITVFYIWEDSEEQDIYFLKELINNEIKKK